MHVKYVTCATPCVRWTLRATLLYQCQNSSKPYFLSSIYNHWIHSCEDLCSCHKPQSPFPQHQNLFQLRCWGFGLRDSDSLPWWWWNLDQTNWDEMCVMLMVRSIWFIVSIASNQHVKLTRTARQQYLLFILSTIKNVVVRRLLLCVNSPKTSTIEKLAPHFHLTTSLQLYF